MDIIMPGMDGFEFLDEIRENPDWQKIPVIVITGKELTSEDHQRLDGQVETIVQKSSLNRDDLLAHVRQLVSDRLNKPLKV